MFNEYLGADWLKRHDDPKVWEKVDSIPDEALWRTHYWLKIKLVDAIYRLLEERIIPFYYQHSESGVPTGWVKVMKEAIKNVGASFSARRMTKEYMDKFYTKALKENRNVDLS